MADTEMATTEMATTEPAATEPAASEMADTEKTAADCAPSCLCPQCGATVHIPAAQTTSTPTATDPDVQLQLQQAREQISALQSQVSHLDHKAAAAIDRWADYEDELIILRKKLAASNADTRSTPTIVSPPALAGPPAATPVTPISPMRASFLPAGAVNRLSALLSPRLAKSTSNLKDAAAKQYSQVPRAMPTPPPSATNGSYNTIAYDDEQSSTTPAYLQTPVTTPPQPRTSYGSFSIFGGKIRTPSPPPPKQLPPPPPMSPSTKELMEALTREQKLRRAAEGRLNDTSREVEELSVSLFEQANEMVAQERRARARLEARVAMLEQRDTDKKARLERLELAMVRIGRLRTMLGDDAKAPAVPPKEDADAASLRAAEAYETPLRKMSVAA